MMNSLMRTATRVLLMALLMVIACSDAASAASVPTGDEVKKIEAAASKLVAKRPQKPRKVLVFCRSWGYKHTAIPYGAKAFEIMGKTTGAFEAVVTYDDVLFEPGHLQQFDAVVFNNTNNEIFLPEDFEKLSPSKQRQARLRDQMLKTNFSQYLSSGKGLAVIHAAVASFRKWPRFGEIIGARFDNHPWSAGSTVTLRVEDPDHPVAKAFKEPLFEVTDEIYQVKDPYSREKLRVLVSLDVKRTMIRLDSVHAIHRKDNDFAMTWVKKYGKGRVYYCALGHQHELFWNPVVIQHYLDGVQFVLGDLEGDTTSISKPSRSTR